MPVDVSTASQNGAATGGPADRTRSHDSVVLFTRSRQYLNVTRMSSERADLRWTSTALWVALVPPSLPTPAADATHRFSRMIALECLATISHPGL